MNKKIFGFLLILLLLFWGSVNYTDSFQRPINQIFNFVKSTYYDTLEMIREEIEEHFFQADTIERMRKELKSCRKKNYYTFAYKQELKKLYKLTDSNITFTPKVELVRAIAYEKFGDTNRLWLEAKEYNTSKIYGLVYKKSVAGIVVPKDGMPLALLIRDPKSSYSVYVGEAHAPGIAHGNNDKNIIVTFIPAWYNIEVGDEVSTSGLDNLFFTGLKVGKVISLSTSQGYQKAVVRPYFDRSDLDYFYMILAPK